MVSITASTMENITESIMETMEKNNQRNTQKDNQRNQKNSQKNGLWIKLALLLSVVAVVAIAASILQKKGQNQAQQKLEQLAAQTTETQQQTIESTVLQEETQIQTTEEQTVEEVSNSNSSEVEVPEDSNAWLYEAGIPVPEKEIDFTKLQQESNEDIYAWIYIPDTKIDYPILQHPEDNVYYLEHNLDGSKGYPGCIYSENYNQKDFSDPNTVLYGHNMKSGAMFAGLHNFEDSQYFEEHPYIYIYTPDNLYVYEIFAAYEYGDEHLLLNYELSDKEVFETYLESIYNVRTMTKNIKEEIEITGEDCILTLSTCIANKPSNRYLVQGVLLHED